MASSIIASVITGGGNSHQTVSEELNAYATDFISQGVVGAIVPNVGSGGSGPFCVNQDASPDMGVTVLAGVAYVSGTPSGQDAQVIRARMTVNYTSYTISSNSSGSTKYDWIYLQLNATNASNPDASADNVINLYTSRSSSNSADNGSPPTYGILLAIVTVANGASSITNSNISDQRSSVTLGGAAGGKVNAAALSNPYKFSVYRNGAWTAPNGSPAKVAFDTKTFDTGTNFDVVTNNRFVAPIAGYYLFSWVVSFTLGGGALGITYLYKNGSQVSTGVQADVGVSQTGFSGPGTYLAQASANDYFEVYCYGDGRAGNANANATNFQGFLVSAT